MIIGLAGCGGFAREAAPIAVATVAARYPGARLVFVDRDPQQAEVNGIPVLDEVAFLGSREDRRFNILIADGLIRHRLATTFVASGALPLPLAHLGSSVSESSILGEGSVLCAHAVITSNSQIGRFFHANLYAYVAHDCIIGDFVTFAPRVSCNGNVVIEDSVYVGTGAMIRDGAPSRPVRIGRGAVIGMGAVVTRDVPAGEVWVGNPARPVRR